MQHIRDIDKSGCSEGTLLLRVHTPAAALKLCNARVTLLQDFLRLLYQLLKGQPVGTSVKWKATAQAHPSHVRRCPCTFIHACMYVSGTLHVCGTAAACPTLVQLEA